MILAALSLGLSMLAADAPERVGLFVGNNGAPPGREPLQHAEADARQMRRVFVELGGLAPEAAHLIEAPSASTVLDAIAKTAAGARVLIFYYSGHADERALLLEGSELSFAELDRALAAAGAELRLELVDACRSGSMTRNKGAKLGDRLQLADERGEGRVVITSSAEWEDSHESDQLGGSFFTLHMASGLRGAADADLDGQVTLSEAYRYVYGRTVESTIGSGAGVQHPSFAYTLSGRGEVVLTWPTRAGGTMVFGDGDYLVIDPGSGRVAAEIATPGARVALPAGTYRVHKRTRDEVFSGAVDVQRGATVIADATLVEREAHARLVRKGREADPDFSHAIRVFAGVRGRVGEGIEAAPIFRTAYELALPSLSIQPYISATSAVRLDTPRLSWSTQELAAGVFFSRALDFTWFTMRGGLGAEALRLAQKERYGRERTRVAWGGAFAAQLALETPPLFADLFASASFEAAIYAHRQSAAELEPVGQGDVATRVAYRALFALGYEL